jgi:hypothetical protein
MEGLGHQTRAASKANRNIKRLEGPEPAEEIAAKVIRG